MRIRAWDSVSTGALRAAWLLGKAWVLAAAVLIVAASGASAAQPDLVAILRAIDEQSNFGDFDFSAVLTIITQDPEKGTEKFVVREFRRDRENKFLLLIQEPKARMGEGYLMDEENLWFYDPESRKFSHTSLKESFAVATPATRISPRAVSRRITAPLGTRAARSAISRCTSSTSRPAQRSGRPLPADLGQG